MITQINTITLRKLTQMNTTCRKDHIILKLHARKKHVITQLHTGSNIQQNTITHKEMTSNTTTQTTATFLFYD